MPAISVLSNDFFSKYNDKPYIVNEVSVKFEFEGENNLNVFITTPNLELESTKSTDFNSYLKMRGNQDVIKLYGHGNIWNKPYTENRIKDWENLWQNNIPFSGFTVFPKDNNENFLGHVALDSDETTPEGAAEISYIFDNKFWGKEVSSEAVWSVVNSYSDEILKRKYFCQDKPYSGIYATARPDNPASIVVLWKSGLDILQQDGKSISTKWGERFTFFKKITDSPLAKSTAELLPNVNKLRLASSTV